MPSKLGITLIDYNNERTTFEIPAASVAAANFDAVNAELAALRTAIEGVTIGNTARTRLLAVDNDISGDPAGSAFAQREIKWLISMRGAVTGKLYQRELGTADLALLAPNTDDMATGAARTALVTALEDSFRGDQNETVTVVSIKFVGRNS